MCGITLRCFERGSLLKIRLLPCWLHQNMFIVLCCVFSLKTAGIEKRMQLRQKLPSAANLSNRFKCKTRLDTSEPSTQLLEINTRLIDVVLVGQRGQAY